MAEMAMEIERYEEAKELNERAEIILTELKTLRNDDKGIIMNRRTDTVDAFTKKH